MASPSKLAALVLMACIITPILVGYVYPSDRTIETGWETSDSHDITDTIRTAEIPTYAKDPTQISGLWNPAGSANTDTASGTITPPDTVLTLELYRFIAAYSNLPIDSYLEMTSDTVASAARVTLQIEPVYPPVPMNPIGPHALIPTSIVAGTESTGHTDVGVWTGSTLILEDGGVSSWSANGYTITPDTSVWDENTILIKSVEGGNTTYSITAVIELSQTSVPTLYLTLGTETIRGSVRLSMVGAEDSTTSVNLIYDNTTIRLETVVNAGIISGRVVSATYDTSETIATIDNIGTVSASPYVRWMWDTVSDSVTLSTMVSPTEPFTTETRSVSLDPTRLIEAECDNAGQWRPAVVSYDNWIAAGVQVGIQNATIIGSQYYPDRNWQLQIKQPSTIGSSLTIAGETFVISGGMITIQDESVPVRGLTILSLASGDGTADIYANGLFIANTSDQRVYLGGLWNCSVILWDVDEYEYYEYVKEWGIFGITQQAYLTVGVMASAAVFLAGVAFSRHNLVTFIAIGGTSGLCALAYIVMLAETIGL